VLRWRPGERKAIKRRSHRCDRRAVRMLAVAAASCPGRRRPGTVAAATAMTPRRHRPPNSQAHKPNAWACRSGVHSADLSARAERRVEGGCGHFAEGCDTLVTPSRRVNTLAAVQSRQFGYVGKGFGVEPPVRIELYSAVLVKGSNRVLAGKTHNGKSRCSTQNVLSLCSRCARQAHP
jgi:hypothetical protein